ncbi:hypothetical protein QR680_005992 [Steinernema hermaphroditum]|uniref:Lipase n=1 Tax=Steinernema hermaphroditum TaxID=289476 RepID=A0AA39HW89_9BILA|nr:hypothetical protein QR680_005992 [Steinernema hermaphroditum]
MFSAFLLATLVAVATARLDPETQMTTVEIINHWGYPSQTVYVTTEDDYVIELHHIPYGKQNGPPAENETRPVVFLQHGLDCSSSNWVVNLPHQSAGFMFADAGYDVWLGNVRGNTYGKKHKTMNPRSEKFWEYSFDEHVKYDLTAMIDTVLNITKQEQVYYVAHSQGTLTMFAKLADDPKFGAKIKKFFALAPVSTVKHIRGFFDVVAHTLYPLIDGFSKIFGSGEFLPSNWLMKLVADTICNGPFIGRHICNNVMFLIAGPDSKQLNITRTAVYVSHTPAGTSTQNALHWAQMVLSGKMQKYDYESHSKNRKHYGMSKPPMYDITNVDVDTYLYWSELDWLADGKDVRSHILPNLNPKILKENNQLKDFNHMDFIWGLRAADEIYKPIMKIIDADFQKNNTSA